MQALRKVCANDIPISVFDLFGNNWSLAFFGALTSVGALFNFTENNFLRRKQNEKDFARFPRAACFATGFHSLRRK